MKWFNGVSLNRNAEGYIVRSGRRSIETDNIIIALDWYSKFINEVN